MTKKITTRRQWRRQRQRQTQYMQCKYILPTPHASKTACFSENQQRGMETKYSFAYFWETCETFFVWIRIYSVWSSKSCNSEFSSNCYSLDRQALNMQAFFYMWVHLPLTFIMSVFVSQFLIFLNKWRLQGHDKEIKKKCVQMSERYKWLKMSHNLWI